MISIANERRAFEDTMRKNGFPEHHLRKNKYGKYLRTNVESAFQGWVMKSTEIGGDKEKCTN